MTHEHSHDSSIQNLRLAFWLNLSFTLLEIIGGFLINSVAILSDALHDLGDTLSLGLAWYLQRYSERGEDVRYTYGYRRFSLLGALINAVILIVGGIIVLIEAIPRLLNPERPNATGMIIMAILGIAVNGLAAWRIRAGRSHNVRVIGWHLLEDVLGWVAVLIVSLVLFFTDLVIFDPLLSILITLYISHNVVRNLLKTGSTFLQAVPDEIDLAAIEAQLQAIDHVRSTHHTHVWSLDGEHHVLTTHVVVAEDLTKEATLEVKTAVLQVIEPLGFEHVTIEIEYENEDCRMK